MQIRSLRPEEVDAWIEFLELSFGHEETQHARHWFSDPYRDLDGILISACGNWILSAVRIFRREIYLGGQVVSVGGIGEACTHPDYKGKGLSGRLLKAAISHMAQQGIALSVLFTRKQQLYARHGWRKVPMALFTARVEPARDESVQIAPANPKDPAEVRQMMALYEPLARSMQGAMVRSDIRYWSDWVAGEWQRAVAARRDGRLVGYLAAQQAPSGELVVQDFAAAPDEATHLFRTMATALAGPQQAGPIRVRCPAALPLQLPHEAVEHDCSLMYRVIDPLGLPTASAHALEQMLRGETANHLVFPTDRF